MGQYEAALTDFADALALDPNCPWCLANRGEIYRRIECDEDARVDLDRAIALDPHCARSFANRGEVYRQRGQHDRALADFDHALELQPDNNWLQQHRAFVTDQRHET